MKLSKNFTVEELMRSDTATRLGIINVPAAHNVESLRKLAENVLQPVRDHFGPIRITSGYRCPALCGAIGSSPNSNHTRGEAADIEPVDRSIKLVDVLSWIHDNLEYRELIAEYFPGGWVHVAYREGGNDRVLKLKDPVHNYSRVSIDYIKDVY